MPDYTMEEICDTFSEAYSQAFKSVQVQENVIEFCNVAIDNIKEEVVDNDEEEFENKVMSEDNMKMELGKAEKKEHSVDLKHHCTSCNYRARRRDTLNQHVKSKHISQDSPVYACENCSYTSNVIDHFRRHMKDGCRSKSVICPFCEKRCLTKDALRTHKRRYHKDTSKHSSAAKKVDSENKAEYTEIKAPNPVNKVEDTDTSKPLDAENKAEYTENKALDAENKALDEGNTDVEEEMEEINL